MRCRVALESVIHPGILPFMVGLFRGQFEEFGLEIELSEVLSPTSPLDGLAEAELQCVICDPLEIFRLPSERVVPLGRLLALPSGLLFLDEARSALESGTSLNVASYGMNDVDDFLVWRFLSQWSSEQGLPCDRSKFQLLKSSERDLFPAISSRAEVCFSEHQDRVHAVWGPSEVDAHFLRSRGQQISFVSGGEGNQLPSVGGLELFANAAWVDQAGEELRIFLRVLREGVQFIRHNSKQAIDIFFEFSGLTRSEASREYVSRFTGSFSDELFPDRNWWQALLSFVEAEPCLSSDQRALIAKSVSRSSSQGEYLLSA